MRTRRRAKSRLVQSPVLAMVVSASQSQRERFQRAVVARRHGPEEGRDGQDEPVAAGPGDMADVFERDGGAFIVSMDGGREQVFGVRKG